MKRSVSKEDVAGCASAYSTPHTTVAHRRRPGALASCADQNPAGRSCHANGTRGQRPRHLATGARSAHASAFEGHPVSRSPRRRGTSEAPRPSRKALHSALRSSPSQADLHVDLDWTPELAWTQQAACLLVPACVCALLYILTAPPRIDLVYGTLMGVVYGLLLVVMRSRQLEQQYKARELLAQQLSEPDSDFTKVQDLMVHVKVKQGALGAREDSVLALHCYHGFGSNVWSWSRVQAPLAQRLKALVTAHDAPGFGLTQRPDKLSEYFFAFNGQLGRMVMDHELVLRGFLAAASGGRKAGTGYPHATVHADPAPVQPTADAIPEPATAAAALESPAGGVPSSTAAATGSSEAPAPADSGVAPAACVAAAPTADTVGPISSVSGAEPALQAVPATDVHGTAVAAAGSAPADQTQATGAGVEASEPPRSTAANRASSKVVRVLMGHSMGGACAALEALARSEDVAALVLVAPAVLASGKEALDSQGRPLCELIQVPAPTLDRQTSYYQSAVSLSYASTSDKAGADKQVTKGLLAAVAGLSYAVSQVFAFCLLLALRPLLLLGLRAAVRSRKFWQNGLQVAYYNASLVTPAVVDAYRSAQLVKGWDSGMVAFVIARVSFANGLVALLRDALSGVRSEDYRLPERLAAVVNARKIPVLFVHGEGDKLVPCGNSKRLACMMPGSELVVMHECGHMPQEEQPEKFTSVVQDFLSRKLALSEA